MDGKHFRPAWTLAGAVACLDLSLAPFAGFSVAAGPVVWALGVATLLAAAAVFFDKVRPRPPISAGLSATAVLIAYTALAAIFSYLTTASALPLQDAAFAAMDEAIGFDFPAHLAWVGQRPWLLRVFETVYFSYAEQLIVIIFGLALTDRVALGRFIHVYAVCAIAVVVGGALLPSIGPYTHHPIGPEALAPFDAINAGRSQIEHFVTLRAGTFERLSLERAEGLVNFPSFHAALAIIFGRALWRIPYVRFPGLVLNAGMMVSALSIGGHYLVDLIGGSVIAVAALLWLDRDGAPAPPMPLDPRAPHG